MGLGFSLIEVSEDSGFMSKAEYLSHLRRRLQDLNSRMAADQKRLASGSPREKVEAAGDLALVEKHLAETKAKLSRLEAEPEGAWENFKTEIEEDFNDLEAAFDRWVERHGKI